MYAAYAGAIEVPAMWDAIAARVDRRPRRFAWQFAAVAALFAVVVSALVFMPRRSGTASSTPGVIAMAHYRAAIARVEPHGRRDPVLDDLRTATRTAEVAASHAPNDPLAVTRAVAAYDAQLQVMRAVHYD